MTTEQIRERLLLCHQSENEINRQIGKIDCQIKEAHKKKKKLALQVSKNMRYRNSLILKIKTGSADR